MDSRVIFSRPMMRGGLFAVIGIGAAGMGVGYDVGTPTAMGAGFFPVLIGALMAAMGIAEMLRTLARGDTEAVPRFVIWPVACLVCGVVGFGLLIDQQGLLLAVLVLVGFALLARRQVKIIEALVIYVLLSLLTSGLYVFGLGTPVSYLLPH
jgi:hypothetical protein